MRRLCMIGLVVVTCGFSWRCRTISPGTQDALAPQARVQLKQADELFHSRSYKEARVLYQEAVRSAKQDKDETSLVEALSMAARCSLILQEREAGRLWLERASKLATPKDPLGWSRYVGVRGRFEWKDQEDNPKAAATFKQMYEYCLQHDLFSRAIDAAHMVAITGSAGEQVDWALKGIDAAEKGNETGWLGPLWNNLGWTYDEAKQYDKALEAFLKARDYHHQGSQDLPKLVADIFVARAYRMAGNLDEAEVWTAKAHTWSKQLLGQNPEDTDYMERLGNTHEELGEIAAARGRYAEAVSHLMRAIELLDKAGAHEWDPKGLERLEVRVEELRAMR